MASSRHNGKNASGPSAAASSAGADQDQSGEFLTTSQGLKFYTAEGNFDLVGNNMPVFFIQDGIKFPGIIHAAKPHPHREIPQAQSAHDTFWISLPCIPRPPITSCGT